MLIDGLTIANTAQLNATPAQLPAVAVSNTSVVASQAEMLALVAEVGDLCIRSDLNQTFILRGESASVLADWEQIRVSTPYDIVVPVFGKPAASEVVLRMKAIRSFKIPANFAGSSATAGAGSSSPAVLSIKRNGSQIATITFNGASGTFSTQGELTIAVGDNFTIVAPASADSTLADIDLSIMALSIS